MAKPKPNKNNISPLMRNQKPTPKVSKSNMASGVGDKVCPKCKAKGKTSCSCI